MPVVVRLGWSAGMPCSGSGVGHSAGYRCWLPDGGDDQTTILQVTQTPLLSGTSQRKCYYYPSLHMQNKSPKHRRLGSYRAKKYRSLLTPVYSQLTKLPHRRHINVTSHVRRVTLVTQRAAIRVTCHCSGMSALPARDPRNAAHVYCREEFPTPRAPPLAGYSQRTAINSDSNHTRLARAVDSRKFHHKFAYRPRPVSKV